MSEAPEYDDLSLFDASSEDELLETALARMQVSLPEWVPDEANTELVLLEALCVLVGLTVYEINEVPQTVVSQLMAAFGVSRDPGKPATGVVEFTMSGADATQEVPAGTTLRYTDEDTGLSYDFTTSETVSVLTDSTLVGSSPVVADEVGVDVNGVSGALLDVVDALPQVESARFLGAVGGGTDPEDDESYFDRGAALFATQTATLVLPEQFTTRALAHAVVSRAKTYSLLNPAAPGVESLGHVTVVLAGTGGAALSEAEQEIVRADLTAKAIAGLIVHAVQPLETELAVKVTLVKDQSATTAEVIAATRDAVSGYFSPEAWDWHSTITANEVVGAAARVEGVAYVESVELLKDGEAVDPLVLESAGYGSLPRLTDCSVTVVNGAL